MNLQDIFTHLAHGELSQLFAGENGEINTSQRPQIVSSISLGLTDLYKRLLIKEKNQAVVITQGTYAYTLNNEDIIQIERIKDSDGEEIVLNNVNDPASFLMIGDKGFSVSDEFFEDKESNSEIVTAYYRANHPEIDSTLVLTNPELVEIELPTTYLQALLYFVAARVHTPVGLTREFHPGNDYLSKYEAEVARLLQLNIRLDRVAESTRFEAGGWV